jgi:hypothetical protein
LTTIAIAIVLSTIANALITILERKYTVHIVYDH